MLPVFAVISVCLLGEAECAAGYPQSCERVLRGLCCCVGARAKQSVQPGVHIHAAEACQWPLQLYIHCCFVGVAQMMTGVVKTRSTNETMAFDPLQPGCENARTSPQQYRIAIFWVFSVAAQRTKAQLQGAPALFRIQCLKAYAWNSASADRQPQSQTHAQSI